MVKTKNSRKIRVLLGQTVIGIQSFFNDHPVGKGSSHAILLSFRIIRTRDQHTPIHSRYEKPSSPASSFRQYYCMNWLTKQRQCFNLTGIESTYKCATAVSYEG
jgi:hypothetical protein